jgi:hypothetical protein
VNKLAINVRKSKFITFAEGRRAVLFIRVAGQTIPGSDHVNFLGLRIDSTMHWSQYLNYLTARTRHFSTLLVKLRLLLDLLTRTYLVETPMLPVINLYNFIYCRAQSKKRYMH